MLELIVILATATGFVGDAAGLPDELSALSAVADNEQQLLEAVRAYDLQQIALAQWDRDLAEKHARAKETALAKERIAQAQRRLQNIRLAYEYLLSNYRNNARAHTYYGELLYDHFGDQAGALRAWQLATSLDKTLSAPLNDLAIHYCHNGMVRRGLQHYEKALELDPDNPDYLFNVVQTYLTHPAEIESAKGWGKTKVYEEAMKMSKRAASLSPDDYTLAQDYAMNFYAAEKFGAQTDWTEAAAAWQLARPLAEKSVETFHTWLNEGRVWLNAGEPAKARACLEQARALRPDSPVVDKLMARSIAAMPHEENAP
ncbi:MAG: hypothetical protein GWP08_16190 [Nitrospiraceae bacterium]|nr:hypothetical protein [Nitrospiraceae bacterium]